MLFYRKVDSCRYTRDKHMKKYTFTTYNIFKAHLPFSRQIIGKLSRQHDFVALQEWVSSLHVRDGEHIVTCPTFTIPFRKVQTGTATISKHLPMSELGLLSQERELGFATKKSLLLTSYKLHDDHTLHIANIHSLNFVTNHTWKKQIDEFLEQIPKHGPLIFAGDFNTWNPSRFRHLEKVMSALGLHYVNYDHNIIMRLDHIWVRDLHALDTRAGVTTHSSDHYPVTLTFALKDTHKEESSHISEKTLLSRKVLRHFF